MKTKVLLSSFLFASIFSFSQVIENTTSKFKTLPVSPSENKALLKAIKERQAKSFYKSSSADPNPAYQARLSHTDAIEAYYGITSEQFELGNDGNTLLANLVLFNDSVPLISTQDATGPITFNAWTMKVGGLFDAKSTAHFSVAENPNYVSEDKNFYYNDYMVDTIWVVGVYSKAPNTLAFNDTLQVEIAWALPTNSSYFLQGVGFSSGTKAVSPLLIDSSKAHGNTSFIKVGSNKLIVKKVLTDSDTGMSNPFYPYIPVPVHQAIPKNNAVAAVYTFVPGYTYTSTDVLYNAGGNLPATINSLRTFYIQQNKGNTTDLTFYDATSRGISYLYDSYQRYGLYTGADAWRNTSANCEATWGMELQFGISANITGINELESNGLKLSDNYPNPVREETVVNYELKENTSVNLSIYDITGKKVMSLDQGKQAAGAHLINLDARSLQAGVYLYTLTAGQNKLTKKMTVVE